MILLNDKEGEVETMTIRHYASFVCGTVAAAVLLVLPGANAFADTSTQVTCKDGSTFPHGGRGAGRGHGGIDKAATAAAAGGTAGGGGATSTGSASPAAPAPAAPS